MEEDLRNQLEIMSRKLIDEENNSKQFKIKVLHIFLIIFIYLNIYRYLTYLII